MSKNKELFQRGMKLLDVRGDILATIFEETDSDVIEYGHSAIALIDAEMARIDRQVCANTEA